LSHNGAGKALVEQVAERLEKQGIACWLDKWNLVPGEPWQPALEDAPGQCATCVVFFGSHGLGPLHNEEMRLALQRRVNSPNRWPRCRSSSPGQRTKRGISDSQVKVWDTQKGELIRVFGTPPGAAGSIAFSRDGRFLAVFPSVALQGPAQ
jgi:hypothetical protein